MRSRPRRRMFSARRPPFCLAFDSVSLRSAFACSPSLLLCIGLRRCRAVDTDCARRGAPGSFRSCIKERYPRRLEGNCEPIEPSREFLGVGAAQSGAQEATALRNEKRCFTTDNGPQSRQKSQLSLRGSRYTKCKESRVLNQALTA